MSTLINKITRSSQRDPTIELFRTDRKKKKKQKKTVRQGVGMVILGVRKPNRTFKLPERLDCVPYF